MKKPEELTDWDFPDTIQVPDGYNMTSIPDLSRDNFNKLLESHNNLVEVVNQNGEVLITLISWLQRELGEQGINQLLEMMPKDD